MADIFSPRDVLRVTGVHPVLIERLRDIFAQMVAIGHPMFVVQGVRTVAQQAALYAQGRTSPGKVVTMKDGVKHLSNHQPHLDHLGHAVDCAFLNVYDPFAETLPWEEYGKRVEDKLLIWGGRWHMRDCPHAELP